ncbi:MAG TPA: DUF3489 domain-containing protein [Candidatus Cybelea sp.]|nr:DUF3489 domain-containing protein [Candidatus Cybelea sp.]
MILLSLDVSAKASVHGLSALTPTQRNTTEMPMTKRKTKAAKSANKTRAHAPRTTNRKTGSPEASHTTSHSESQAAKSTKQAHMIALLRRPEGVSIAEIGKHLDWQLHTVRGVLSAVVKKKLGLVVTSEKSAEGPRRYRLQ